MADENAIKFTRALILLDEVEAEVRDMLSGRLHALYGLWTCRRAELEVFLRRWSFFTPLVGREFDEEVRGFLMRYTPVDLRAIDFPARRRPRATVAAPEFSTETRFAPGDLRDAAWSSGEWGPSVAAHQRPTDGFFPGVIDRAGPPQGDSNAT